MAQMSVNFKKLLCLSPPEQKVKWQCPTYFAYVLFLPISVLVEIAIELNLPPKIVVICLNFEYIVKTQLNHNQVEVGLTTL